MLLLRRLFLEKVPLGGVLHRSHEHGHRSGPAASGVAHGRDAALGVGLDAVDAAAVEHRVQVVVQARNAVRRRRRRRALERGGVPGDGRLHVPQVRRRARAHGLGVTTFWEAVDAAPVAGDGVPDGDAVDAVLAADDVFHKGREALDAAELDGVRLRRPLESPREVGVFVVEMDESVPQRRRCGRAPPQRHRHRVVAARLHVRRVRLAEPRREGLVQRHEAQLGQRPRHLVLLVDFVVQMRRDGVGDREAREGLAGHEGRALVVQRRGRGRFSVELHPAVVDDEAPDARAVCRQRLQSEIDLLRVHGRVARVPGAPAEALDEGRLQRRGLVLQGPERELLALRGRDEASVQ
mmetsp:Transcript_16672/g.50510  ORF Transcript_16672/g.50510 Transcript_16672/m.50510 type:complete len:351 (+) Transcript_16672:1711-2763(+)